MSQKCSDLKHHVNKIWNLKSSNDNIKKYTCTHTYKCMHSFSQIAFHSYFSILVKDILKLKLEFLNSLSKQNQIFEMKRIEFQTPKDWVFYFRERQWLHESLLWCYSASINFTFKALRNFYRQNLNRKFMVSVSMNLNEDFTLFIKYNFSNENWDRVYICIICVYIASRKILIFSTVTTFHTGLMIIKLVLSLIEILDLRYSSSK